MNDPLFRPPAPASGRAPAYGSSTPASGDDTARVYRTYSADAWVRAEALGLPEEWFSDSWEPQRGKRKVRKSQRSSLWTPAQAKALTEAAGLGPTWLARTMDVRHDSARRWIVPGPMPDDVVEVLNRALSETERVVAELIDENPTVLTTYIHEDFYDGPYTAAWHRSVSVRVSRRTGAQIQWSQPHQNGKVSDQEFSREVDEQEEYTKAFIQEWIDRVRREGHQDLVTYLDDAHYRAHEPQAKHPATWHRAAAVRVFRSLDEGVRLVYAPLDE
jgi:hypothetical protein